MNKKNPSADRYTLDLPAEDGIIMDVLRDFILSLNDEFVETFKYQCPFFTYNGMFCYLTFDKKIKTVALGFVLGYKLEDKYGLLSTDRKQIRKLHFKTVDDIDEEKLRYYFEQAIYHQKLKKKNG